MLEREYFIFPKSETLFIVDKTNVYGFNFDQLDLVIAQMNPKAICERRLVENLRRSRLNIVKEREEQKQ